MSAGRQLLIFCTLCSVAASSAIAGATDQEARLSDALNQFDSAVATRSRSGPEAERLFRKALDGFESLVNEGVRSGALYFNIGNTYMRLGELGHAIVNYRRGLRLDPGNEGIRKNLQVARNTVESQFSRPATSALLETLFFWHFGTSAASRLRVALGAYLLFWGLMVAWLLLPRRVAALKGAIVFAGAVALASGISMGWDTLLSGKRIEGVVTADKAVVRKGNGDYYDPQFDRPISKGVEFTVLESRQDVQGAGWYRVELPNGKEGWIRADQADVL
jgi:tetratricopeptide (TPR) repeat protein